MKEIKAWLKKMSKSNFVTSMALLVISLAEMSTQTCITWIFGQDDMPEELL